MRKSFSENFPQFRHASSEHLDSPVVGGKNERIAVLIGAKSIPVMDAYISRFGPACYQLVNDGV